MFLDCSPVVLAVPVKVCTKCGEAKPATLGYFHSKGRDKGLHSWCKVCVAERTAANKESRAVYWKTYYTANRERERKRVKAYDAAYKERKKEWHAAHKEQAAERSKKWRADNRERKREFDKLYRERHPDKERERKKAYNERFPDKERERKRIDRQTHPDRERARWHRRRARIISAPGSGITVTDIDAMRRAQTDKRGRVLCWICGKPMPPDDQTLEHWIPLDKGGAHDPGNCHLAHGRCNYSKGAKHPNELGRLL